MRTRVMIMAGGTGGHVFPALAVANELRDRGVEVIWMGTHEGLEADLIPRAGFEIRWVSVGGLRGKGPMIWAAAPFKLARATIQSLAILLRARPRVVLGMGGFVTGPGGVVSWLLRRPLILHEQNAVLGLTNRLLKHLARRTLSGFPDVFSGLRSTLCVGNPVRREIAALPMPEKRFRCRHGPLRLLVLGGSLGAVTLNQVVPQALAAVSEELRPEIWHQTGRRNLEGAQAIYAELGIEVRIAAFIDDMGAAYGWADLAICRAGALTLAELTVAGVGAILIPYPHAVDDHQTANARHLVDAGAAILIPEAELTAQRLQSELTRLADDRGVLAEMAVAARSLAQPNAAREVADICVQEAIGG